jgi:hypothetical protein
VNLLRRLFAWTILVEGSTRPAALMRMGIVALAWAEWSGAFIGPRSLEPASLLTGVALSVFGMATLLGLGTRVSSAGFAATLLAIYYYWGHHRGVESYVHHHSWVLVAGGMGVALLPAGGSYSIDRWWAVRRARRRGEPQPPESGPLWGQRLIAMQVSLVYFWGAYDKLQPGFWSGVRMQHHWLHYYGGSDYPRWVGFPWLMQGISVGTVVLEFAMAFLLFVPRIQVPLMVVGLLFHWGLYQLLPVGTFSLTMWLLYLAYLDADAVHRWIDGMAGPTPGDPTHPGGRPPAG